MKQEESSSTNQKKQNEQTKNKQKSQDQNPQLHQLNFTIVT